MAIFCKFRLPNCTPNSTTFWGENTRVFSSLNAQFWVGYEFRKFTITSKHLTFHSFDLCLISNASVLCRFWASQKWLHEGILSVHSKKQLPQQTIKVKNNNCKTPHKISVSAKPLVRTTEDYRIVDVVSSALSRGQSLPSTVWWTPTQGA